MYCHGHHKPSVSRRSLRGLLLAIVVSLPAISLAQDQEPIEYAAEQVQELTKQLGQLKDGAMVEVPEVADDQGVFVVADGAIIGSSFLGARGGNTYAIVQLRVANMTPEPFTLTTSTIRLQIKDTQLAHQAVPSRQGIGTNRIKGGPNLSRVRTLPQVEIGSGRMKFVIATFMQLPVDMPYDDFRITVKGLPTPVSIDLMAQVKDELGLTSKRIGPRKCLGVVRVNKRLGPLGSHHLVREIDTLISDGATRIALVFGDSAERLSVSTNSWLTSQTTPRSSYRRVGTYPQIPTSVAAFHVGPRPAVSVVISGSRSNANNHPTNAAAIAAALFDVYQQVPVADVIKDIENGDSDIRLAAVRGGIGRFGPEVIPVLTRFAGSESDRSLRVAALRSLSHFPNKEASNVVLAAVTDPDAEVGAAAVRALADSRFPAAREALMGLLDLNTKSAAGAVSSGELDEKKRLQIANRLIETPDSHWRDLYFEYASRPNGIGLKSLNALLQVGHPRRTELLADLLESKSTVLRNKALQALVGSRDAKERDIAMRYTLDYIQEKSPTRDMLAMLRQSTSSEVAPLLVRRFKDVRPTGSLRSIWLDAIVSTSDPSTISFFHDLLADKRLSAREKAKPLKALQALDRTKAVAEATKLVETTDLELARAAYGILEDHASPEVVRRIGDHLLGGITDKRQDTVASIGVRALRVIATPPAREYLRMLQNCKNEKRRKLAGAAVDQLVVSSPAILLLQEARTLREDDKIAEAERVFEKAKKLDPELPELYVQHGHLLTHTDRRALGVKEFDKALAVDPRHPIATSLKCIAVVVLGDVEEGLSQVEYHQDKFQYDQIFNYNAACAYGQAIKRTKATAENVEQVAEWKLKSVEYLERCINELQFNDVKLFKEDPDLDALRDTPRFKKLLKKLDPDADKKPDKPAKKPEKKQGDN